MVMGWDEWAFAIMALEVIGWLVAEIGRLRTIGYGVVFLTVGVLFLHLARYQVGEGTHVKAMAKRR
jgi:hypothetical protein